MKQVRCAWVVLVALIVIASGAMAHNGQQPSTHDTLAGIVERFKTIYTQEGLMKLTLEQVEAALSEGERIVLGTQHLRFTTKQPVRVFVVHDVQAKGDPYWLRGFQATEHKIKVGTDKEFDVWLREYPAGEVGLGVNSLSGRGKHYFVLIEPVNPGEALELSNIYPGAHTTGVFDAMAKPWADDEDMVVTNAPDALKGRMMLRGLTSREKEAQLLNVFRVTPYPASARPDHVILTWDGDPKRTQAIQWRTSGETSKGFVAYLKKSDLNQFQPKKPILIEAELERIESRTLVNDPVMHRHTARLRGLEPGTTYLYSVGDGSEEGWSELTEFTTAPDGIESFSFIYMGDAQNGLERWGSLVKKSFLDRPDAAFYIMAGDLVNRGAERDDWDSFFKNAHGIFNRRQVVPIPGNHEYQGGDCELYLKMFALPETGPLGERAYSFEYSNALFVCLDSNVPVETQNAWLEEQLAGSKAKWKFVTFHHPAYSSSPKRNNPDIKEQWGAIFDKYHVDLALQGHDHAYLRTYPMKAGQRVETAADGTIYIVSVSGTKFYEQGDFDYTEFGMTKVATYQAIDIQVSGDRLLYRSYDDKGNLRDEFEILK